MYCKRTRFANPIFSVEGMLSNWRRQSVSPRKLRDEVGTEDSAQYENLLGGSNHWWPIPLFKTLWFPYSYFS